MTTFTILEFPRAEGAEYMLRTLQKLQEQHLIQIEDGAILIWPLGARKPKLKQLTHLTGASALSEAFWGMLLGLLFAVPIFGAAPDTAIGALVGRFAHYGIDECFIKRVHNQITEGTSALFLLTSGAVIDKVMGAVKCMQFEIISTNLSQEQENQLLETFGESSVAAVVMTDWREEYAYTLGLQAYIYGFPWVFLSHLRWQWVSQPVDPDTTPYAALNHFWHRPSLMDAQYRDGGSPTTDTLYSIAWLDLRQEPIILSHPAMGTRSFTFALISLDADTFATVGTRTSGQQAGHYAIVAPGWQGRLPPGVQALAPSRTPSVLVCGYTHVDGPQDVAQGRALLKHYRLTPLSHWGQPGARAAGDHRVWQPVDAHSDPLATWKTMNRAMTEEPPEARHAALLKLFASIGLGPNQQVERLDAATQRGLVRAALAGPALLAAVCAQGGSGKRVNGWCYPPPALGRAGQHDDFLTRAALQCAAGIIAHDPHEVVCLTAYSDDEGQPLSGSRGYRLHFAPEGLPPVQACWSLTLYGADHNLVENPIERYSIGDRTPELLRDPDGGLTLVVQHDPPAADEMLNWLPAPRGAFNLILRAYLPAREIMAQTWQPPALKQVYPAIKNVSARDRGSDLATSSTAKKEV